MTKTPRKPRTFSVEPSNEKPEKAFQTKAATKTTAKARKPRAIKSDAKLEILPQDAVLQNDSDLMEDIAELDNFGTNEPVSSKSKISWFTIAFSAFSALFLFGVGLYFETLLGELFARHLWLGWAASILIAIGVFALIALALREIFALFRLRKITSLRNDGKLAVQNNDLKLAKEVTQDICSLVRNHPQTAKGRQLAEDHMQSVLDGADLIHLVERDLLSPMDKTARKMIMDSAKRVSIVTAVSPRALVDVGYILYENTKLIRMISQHYGARSGKLGMWRLTKRIITHLAATGAIAIGDSLVQQLVGHGLAAKLSARLGEGVINGLLTARVGIAAIDVCRPLAFEREKRPGINDFLSELTSFSSLKAKK